MFNIPVSTFTFELKLLFYLGKVHNLFSKSMANVLNMYTFDYWKNFELEIKCGYIYTRYCAFFLRGQFDRVNSIILSMILILLVIYRYSKTVHHAAVNLIFRFLFSYLDTFFISTTIQSRPFCEFLNRKRSSLAAGSLSSICRTIQKETG